MTELASVLVDLNNRGGGVFVTVNEVASGMPRKTGNITRVRSLFVDADDPAQINRTQQGVHKFGVPTSLIVESSPDKYHLGWLTEGCPLDQFKEAQTALAEIFGTDPSVVDLPRVLRLAGFIHRKGAPFRSILHQGELDRIYPFATLLARIKAASDPNSNVVSMRARCDAGKPLAGTPPALAKVHQSTLNDAAQVGVEQGWFEKLTTESKNELLRKIADDEKFLALANTPRVQWRGVVWGFKHAEELGATEAKDIARKWSKDGSSDEHPFTAKDFEDVWKSFDPDRPDAKNVGTLLGAAKKVGFDTKPWRDLANGVTTVVNPSPAAALPTIRVSNGLRHEVADAGLLAMRGARVPFYQRGNELVRICRIPAKTSDGKDILIPGIMQVALSLIERELGKSARWEKCNREGDWLRIDPPQHVVKQIAVMTGEWDFPTLVGVTSTPTLRSDGSVLDTPGYDSATGFYLFDPPSMPAIPPNPSKADAVAALGLLNDLLTEFPFVDDESHTVALSMLMTPVLRGAFSVVPLHAVTAPGAGTGKSYLASTASVIATGERCAVKAAAPNPEETEKRLMGAVLDGRQIVAIDNLNGELTGDFLCQLTEQELLEVRRLGKSDTIRVRNSFTVLANGNNLTVVGDQVRRTLLSHMDANMENPEKRVFHTNPIAMVLADRGRYVAAILTIARAYIVAGRPGRLPPLASYEGWSDLVRSALVWLGCADPVGTMATAAASDPIRQQCAAVFAAWATELPLAPTQFQTKELIEKTTETVANSYPIKYVRPLLRDTLQDVAGARNGLGIDGKGLGKWLTRHAGTVSGGNKLEVDRSDKARPRWRLTRV